MAKRCRPQKPYQTSWNVPVAGLARDTDGRWRVLATGERFTEPDERRAVARFYDATRANRVERLTAPVAVQVANGSPVRRNTSLVAMDRFVQSLTTDNPITVLIDRLGGSASASQEVDAAILWDWLKEQLTERPGWVAKMVGIPELVSLAHFELPKAPITVRQVIDEYRKHSMATDKSKREAIKQFERLIKFTGARTLDEATSDQALISFREQLMHDPELNSTDTIGAYLARIRGVIRLAGRGKLDAVQITAAVARCKAKLYAPPSNVDDDPHPISRENFHSSSMAASKRTCRKSGGRCSCWRSTPPSTWKICAT